MHFRFILLLGSLLLPAHAELDFNLDVRPILSDKCFFCHGPDGHERKADLRLDTQEGSRRVPKDGVAAIVPGDPDASEMVKRMLDTEDPMPPEESHKTMKPEEIAILTQWIKEGGEYSDAWAYVAPVKTEEPVVSDTDWPKNWIDHFVHHRLESEELDPSTDADAVTLMRRLHFDLTGLPPSPADVDAYVKGETSYEEVVDRLFASPLYGERMAMYWLDLVRFADTVGYHGDQDHNISPYRDYVIRSFNQNLPFDQFTREQLAGDLLEDAGKWQKVASGYNRLLQTSHEGGIQLKEYNTIYAADRVRNVSEVWMGATVGCAQCHDHKYDPFTIQDHYAMAAFFADLHDVGYTGNTLPTERPPEMLFFTDAQEARLGEILAAQRKIAGSEDALQAILKQRAEHQKLSEAKPEKEQAAAHAEKLKAAAAKLQTLIPEGTQEDWSRLDAEETAIRNQGRYTMITEAKPPREMRVLPRGNWQDDSGEIVYAAVPTFLGEVKNASTESAQATRLDLANWLTDAKDGSGGLTARVFANRFWYLFFGTGISRSLSDFGGQGEPPSDLQLLDNLAVHFMNSGWDVKDLLRLMVTSRAYRQSSVASDELLDRDPYNQLMARQSRYRLPAEMIRDNALAVSGLLQQDIGGNSIKPYQPAGYYKHLNFPPRGYENDVGKLQWRRGLYVHWQRMFLHPMLKAMDAPSREECSAERPRSNTPTAALVLLNDPTFIEASRVFAARILTEGGADVSSRLTFAYREALSRAPDAEERKLLTDLLEMNRTVYKNDEASAKALLATGIAPLGGREAETKQDFDVVELAAWTAVARAILNLNETVTRN